MDTSPLPSEHCASVLPSTHDERGDGTATIIMKAQHVDGSVLANETVAVIISSISVANALHRTPCYYEFDPKKGVDVIGCVKRGGIDMLNNSSASIVRVDIQGKSILAT